jgi:hypothetical protein
VEKSQKTWHFFNVFIFSEFMKVHSIFVGNDFAVFHGLSDVIVERYLKDGAEQIL